MSESKYKFNDGGSAFPVCNVIVPEPGHYTNVPASERGMSLRDWFAGQALTSLLHNGVVSYEGPSFEDHVAHNAYRFADAMLAARKVT